MNNVIVSLLGHSDIRERDEFYKSVSFDGWGGSSGHGNWDLSLSILECS